MTNYLFSIVPVDGLALSGAWSSTSRMVTDIMIVDIYIVYAFFY